MDIFYTRHSAQQEKTTVPPIPVPERNPFKRLLIATKVTLSTAVASMKHAEKRIKSNIELYKQFLLQY